jgi:hypothetical protein
MIRHSAARRRATIVGFGDPAWSLALFTTGASMRTAIRCRRSSSSP